MGLEGGVGGWGWRVGLEGELRNNQLLCIMFGEHSLLQIREVHRKAVSSIWRRKVLTWGVGGGISGSLVAPPPPPPLDET